VQLGHSAQVAALVEFTQDAVCGDGIGQVTVLAAAADNVAEVVVFHVAQDGSASPERHCLEERGDGEVPELDVAVADSDEVAAVLRERDALDLAGDLVGGDFELGAAVPHVDDHVVHGADGHEEIGVGTGRKGDAVDGELVPAELAQLHFVAHVPHSHFGLEATLLILFEYKNVKT